MADCHDVSESDSSDGNSSRLREAVDNDFMNDSMFNGGPRPSSWSEGKQGLQMGRMAGPTNSLISLRDKDDDSQQYNGLHVTPEFQRHVAKHLEKILDSQLKEKRKKKTHLQPRQEPVGGVKLFSDSPVYLSSNKEILDQTNRLKVVKRKRVPSSSSEGSELDSRFYEAAVTHDWVLKQTGTKGWKKSTKGTKIVINSKGDVIMEEKI